MSAERFFIIIFVFPFERDEMSKSESENEISLESIVRIAIKTCQESSTLFCQTRRTYVQIQRRWTMEIEKIVQNKAKKSLFPKENK